jgi:4'-phosphopantetheinyl transferase
VLPPLALPDADAHLWLFPLDAEGGTVAALTEYLAPGGQERAARFRHADDVRRYRVARGALRALLARYLGEDPGAIRFVYGTHGKPALAPEFAHVDLQFNLSHSGDVALAAFCVGRSIGVDLERADRTVDALALAGRYGSVRERAVLEALDPGARSRHFIELWTCKEAWLKATGLGITAGLAKVDIDLSGTRPRIVRLPDGQGAQDWSLAIFEAAVDLAAAVALRDPNHEIGDVADRRDAALVPGLSAARLMLTLRARL